MNLVVCYSLISVTVITEMHRYIDCLMMDLKLNSEPDPHEELGFRQSVRAVPQNIQIWVTVETVVKQTTVVMSVVLYH